MSEQCEKMDEDSQFIHPPFPHFSYLNTPKTNSLNFCHFTTTSAPVTFANSTTDISDNYSNPYIKPTPMNPLVSASHPSQPPVNHSFSSSNHALNRAYEERMEVLEMPIGIDNLAGVSKSFSGELNQNETLWDSNERNAQENSILSPTQNSVHPHINNNNLNNSKTNNLANNNTSNTNNNFVNQHLYQFLQETKNNNPINPAIFASMTAPTMLSWHPPIPYRSLHSMKIPPQCLVSKTNLTPRHYHPYQSNDKNSEKRDQNLTHMMKNHQMNHYMSSNLNHQVTDPVEAMIINNIQNTISNSYAYKAGRTISSNNLVNNQIYYNEKNFDAVTARRTHSAPSGKSKQKNSYLDEIFSNSLIQNNDFGDEDDSENEEEEDENGHSIIGINPKVVNELLNNVNYIPAHHRSKSNDQINFSGDNLNNNIVNATPVHQTNSANKLNNNFDSTNANFNRENVYIHKKLKGMNQMNSFQHLHSSAHSQENVNNSAINSEDLDDSNEEDDSNMNINFELLDDDDYEKMSVKHLKQRCKSLGLLISGNKSQLIERLKNPQNSIRKRKRSVKSYANNNNNNNNILANSLPGDVNHSSNSLVNPLINHPNNLNVSQNTSNLPIFTPNFTNEPSNFNNGNIPVHNIPIYGNDDKLKAMKKIKQQERKARPESKEKLIFTSKYKLAKVNNNQTSSNNNNNNTLPTIANGVSSVDNCDKNITNDVKNVEASMKKRGKKNTEQSKFIFHFSNNTKLKHGSKRNRNRNQNKQISDPVYNNNKNNTRQSIIKEEKEKENDVEGGENSNSNSDDERSSI